MGYISTVQINNGTEYLIEPTLFATTSGSSEAFSASITNFELTTGVMITLQIHTNNVAGATLSINNQSRPLYYNDVQIEDNILKQGHIYNLVYINNKWCILGEKLSNSEMILPHKLTFGAGQTYVYDGSADVTVPVYTGSAI